MRAALLPISLLIFASPARAIDPAAVAAAVQAPTICQNNKHCDGEVSLADAQSSFRMNAPFVRGCYMRTRQPASLLPSFDDPCDTLIVAIERDPCDDDLNRSEIWAPAYLLPSGGSKLHMLLDALSSGTLIDGFLPVAVENPDVSQRRIALCDTIFGQNASGSPTNCTMVAIVTANGSWLRAAHRPLGCPAAAYIRQNGSVEVTFSVKGLAQVRRIAASLKAMASNMGLAVRGDEKPDSSTDLPFVRFGAASGIRPSSIIAPGWRETLGLDVNVYRNTGTVKISATATALVSRQNAGQLSDFRGLTSVQQQQYAEALNRMTLKAIKSSCSKISVSDSENVICS